MPLGHASDVHNEFRAEQGDAAVGVTLLVDGLVQTGFVTREPCPTDRRATLVTFTELGRATAHAMADGHRELARRLFADLSAEAFDGFDAGLSHLIDRLRTVLSGRRVLARVSSLCAMKLPHPGRYLDG